MPESGPELLITNVFIKHLQKELVEYPSWVIVLTQLIRWRIFKCSKTKAPKTDADVPGHVKHEQQMEECCAQLQTAVEVASVIALTQIFTDATLFLYGYFHFENMWCTVFRSFLYLVIIRMVLRSENLFSVQTAPPRGPTAESSTWPKGGGWIQTCRSAEVLGACKRFSNEIEISQFMTSAPNETTQLVSDRLWQTFVYKFSYLNENSSDT